MHSKFISLILFTLFSFSVFSQKRIEPTNEDINKAQELKKRFKDDHVSAIISKDVITFNRNKRTKKVIANHIETSTLINLDSRSDILFYSFYDNQTIINEFSFKYRNNKSAYFLTKDEAYKSNDLFHHDSRVKSAHVDFPLKGYKYKTKIDKKIKDVKYLTKIYFNGIFPIEKKVIRFEIPTWLNLELKEINFDKFNISKEVTTNDKTNTKTHTYTLENVPAMYKDKYSPGPTYIYPHILILPKSFNNGTEDVTIFSTTQDLYNWYKSLVDELTNEKTSYKTKVTSLIKDVKTDEEKIKNIFYWIQDNIRYIAFEDGIAGFKPDEADNVYTKKYGDCKGMANLTKNMLIEAGFDARLTWIGTKRIAYDYSTPNLSVDNHMICTLFTNGKTYFLDGTEKFNSFGEYAHRIQGKQVLIEDNENFIIKTVPEVNDDFNKEIINYNFELQGEILVGKSTQKYLGESRTGFLYRFDNIKNDDKEEAIKSFLNRDNRNIKVSNIITSNFTNRDIDVNITYDLTIKNIVSSFDNIIYIDLDLDKELAKFKFKDRKTAYLFNYKKNLETTTTLTFPNNYKVESLPKNISLISDDFDIKVTFTQNANQIIYKKQFKIKNAKITSKDFDKWNEFNEKLNNIYNEQITLIKQ